MPTVTVSLPKQFISPPTEMVCVRRRAVVLHRVGGFFNASGFEFETGEASWARMHVPFEPVTLVVFDTWPQALQWCQAAELDVSARPSVSAEKWANAPVAEHR